MLNKNQTVVSCAKQSKLKKEYHHEWIQELLEKPLKRAKRDGRGTKKKIVQKEYNFKQTKEITLKKHFKNYTNLPSRNSAINRSIKRWIYTRRSCKVLSDIFGFNFSYF